MTYPVVLIESEGEFAVGCPSLPGCWSQGKTREEALENIREAIALWLEVEEEDIRQELEGLGKRHVLPWHRLHEPPCCYVQVPPGRTAGGSRRISPVVPTSCLHSGQLMITGGLVLRRPALLRSRIR